jgi:hypothetical protein
MKNLTIALMCAGLVFQCSQTVHAGSVASAAKKGAAVGYAKVAINGTVLAYGGKGTTGVTSFADGGAQTVTFTGKYPDDLSPGKVIATSTAEASIYGVTNLTVGIANATTIVVTVYDWKSDNTNNWGSDIHVVLHIGQ